MAGRLKGKVAIITGAASGIGAESARLFAVEGARVALGDVNTAGLADVVAEIERAGGEAISLAANVAEEEEVAALVNAAVESFGRLDVLFSNAGVGTRGTVVELPMEQFDRIIGVNLRGSFLCAKYAVPHIAAAGGGSVIFTASELALVGSLRNSAYCASKAALIAMARAMALDHAPENIRFTCICPGAIDTPMLRGSITNAENPAAYEQSLVNGMPFGRIGRPDEIAKAALFLASDESSFVTGTALVVDGGWTAR